MNNYAYFHIEILISLNITILKYINNNLIQLYITL